MKRLAAAVVTLAGLCLSGGGAAKADKAALVKKQTTLAAEYALAKDPGFYFVLDMSVRRLELRVRGMALRSWPVRSTRFWGGADFSGAVELARRSALKPPARIVIKPGQAGEEPAAAEEGKAAPAPASQPASPAEFQLEALELKDMPKSFTLYFDNGLTVEVRSEKAKEVLRQRLWRFWRWTVALPLGNLFSPSGKGRTKLELVFAEDKEAQGIYWHFFEGIRGIIL